MTTVQRRIRWSFVVKRCIDMQKPAAFWDVLFTNRTVMLSQGNEYGVSSAPEVFFRISSLGATSQQSYFD
jgi:hypothetical protein